MINKELLHKIKKHPLIKTSTAYIFTSFLIKGMSFITTPIFTRMMKIEDYGIISNFQTWLQFFSIFIFLQVSSGLLPAKINKELIRFNSYVKNVVIFGMTSAFIQITIFIIFKEKIEKWINIDSTLIPVLGLCAIGTAMSNIISAYYIAVESPKKKIIFSVLSSIIFLGSGLGCVYFSRDKSLGRIVGYAINNSIILLFGLFLFLKNKVVEKKEFMEDVKSGLKYGIPLIPHLIANVVNGSSDRIFLLKICGESQVGIYSIAYAIGALTLTLVESSADAWNPWYFKQTLAKKNQKIKIPFKIYTLTIGMCFVGIMFLAPDIIKIMAPKEYWEGTRCILFVALGVFFLFLYRFPLLYEQFLSTTKYVAPATILTAIINIVLNTLLIPKYNINGAAIATTLSYIVLWLTHEFVARKIIKGYNISKKNYIISVIIVIIGFILSNIVLEFSISRYIILVIFCIIYLIIIFKYIKVAKSK